MTEMPPSRFRVVERGRRLEVIDRRSGERVGSRVPVPMEEQTTRRSRPWLPRQVRFDGGAELTTHPLYDEKAPRTIQLDPGSAALIRWVEWGGLFVALAFVGLVIAWPWLLLGLVIPFQRQFRTGARGAITRWLDKIERENG